MSLADSKTLAATDAFGRLRVSTPTTLFDSKQHGGDQLGVFWDDQETSGGGTGSAHSAARSSTSISVSASTAGKRVRQTYQYFNYQPGKSQAIMITFVLGAAKAGITRRVGYFNGSNGVYLEQDGDGMRLGIMSDVGGSVAYNEVSQANWSINPLNSSKGVNLDLAKAQILYIDLEWLGVGTVRVGFVIDGVIYYAHAFHHANISTGIYMRSANLPIRYEIENDGTGSAASLECICSTVISEGGSQDTGMTYSVSTGATQCNANAAGTLYAVLSVQLKSDHLYSIVQPVGLSMYSKGTVDFEWMLLLNGTVAGTFIHGDVANTSIQKAQGDTANTITADSWTQVIAGGYSTETVPASILIPTTRYLGSSIAGTSDRLVLAVRPLGANADIYATLILRENA